MRNIRSRSRFSLAFWLASLAFIFVLFYYVFSLFVGPVSITTVEDTEGVDLAQNPLWVNFTHNREALNKLEDFKQVDFVHLRPKQQEAVVVEYIPLIGVNGILDVLELDAEKMHERCHNQAHIVGITATWITEDLEFLMDVVKDRCDSAAFHGVVEAKLLDTRSNNKNKDLKLLSSTIQKICAHPSVSKIFETGECAHVIGFSFMMMDSEFHEAIDACFEVAKFPGLIKQDENSINWAFYCSEGVFKNYLYNYCSCSTILEPCTTNTTAPGACWTYKFSHMGLEQDETTKITKRNTCQSLPKVKQPACFYGYGYFLGSFFDPLEIRECESENIDLDAQIACVDGLISMVMTMNDEHEVQDYCDLITNTPELFKACQEVAKGGLFSMTKDVSKYIF